MEWQSATVAGVLAAFLTYTDLDRVFDPTQQMKGWDRCKLTCLWWGFVIANGLLALALLYALDELGYLKETNPWLKGLIVGGGYATLIRTKLTTLPIGGKDIPFGFEMVYESIKGMIHKRINRIIRQSRAEEMEKLTQLDTEALRTKARTLVMSDALVNDDQSKVTLQWIQEIAVGKGIQDADRRIHLATFIVTGQTRPRP